MLELPKDETTDVLGNLNAVNGKTCWFDEHYMIGRYF